MKSNLSVIKERGGGPALLGASTTLLFVVYLVVFLGTSELDLTASSRTAFVNAGSAAITAAPVYWLVQRFVIGRTQIAQAVLHAFVAPVFTLALYAVLIFFLAFAEHRSGQPFKVTPFSGPALPWQLMQGLMMYCVVAALAFGLRERTVVDVAAGRSADQESDSLSRYLIRRGDVLQPIDVADIISITGADDYSEVSTSQGKHLARLSLADFERRLGSDRFLRVHRSRIVNFDRLVRAELERGGRMVAHMEDGEVVPVSRAGAQALRQRVM